MRLAALGAAAALALALPGVALAHAALRSTTPSFQKRVETAPPAVVLRFDQGVRAVPGSIEVRSVDGALVSGPARRGGGRFGIEAPLRRLPRGAYTVRWHVLSEDGHVVSGVFTFGVDTAAPPPTEAVGASGPTRTEHVVRWAYFLALALLVGGLGFRLLVVRGPLPARAERRFYLLTAAGAVATLEVGIAAFLLRAEDALQLPFGRLLYGDLSPIAAARFGTAFIAMTLGFALVAALLFLAWLTDRTLLLWPAFLVALGFVSGLSLSGHSAADPGSSWLSALADWAHLAAACLWIGGLVQLALCLWPLAPELRRAAFLTFSQLATMLVALLVAAGTYLSIVRLPHASDLWTSGYGHVLLVKLGLVAAALAWGGLHRVVARPLVARGASAGLARRLPRSLLGEAAVGMAVLLAAAVLVDSRPPAPVAPEQVTQVAR
jgi:copper transport protein